MQKNEKNLKISSRGTPLTSVSLPKSLRLLGHDAFGNCDSLAEISIPADHAISSDEVPWMRGTTENFEAFFSGTKINESITLQKLLKETKPREISNAEADKIESDIKKQIDAKKVYQDKTEW